ncbi:putative nuclease HARBI1 [Pyxicephalus adspersus]|uniref:putative nuclease HARBI1 n=1 Tax=Pyxicephalus adspersus TaxID=30357 RepID=UPI003B5AB02B
MTRLLATLYILGRGSFQTSSVLNCGLSQSTFSRVFTKVINAIVDLVPLYIHFPQTEWRKVKVDFFRQAGFPNVLGAIDGTYMAIKAPKLLEIAFRNQKRYQKLISGEMPEGWLIADKGYGQLPWLMTAVHHPWSKAEHNYKKALHKSRGIVEHTIGLLKAQFLCLVRPGGELLYAPWKAVIMACRVLHNLCLHHGDTWDIPEELEPEVHQHPASSSQSTAEGRRVRDELIANVFA